jgi:hypothetical protein
MTKPTKSQRKRRLKKARDARAASRLYVNEFKADACAVIRRSVLVDESSFAIFAKLPTDGVARISVLAPAVKRPRIVRGMSAEERASLSSNDATRAPIGTAAERLQLVRSSHQASQP